MGIPVVTVSYQIAGGADERLQERQRLNVLNLLRLER